MDINKRKPRIINLKKRGKVRVERYETPVKVHVDDLIIAPAEKQWIGGTFPCIQCGVQEAQEFGRCKACDTEHQKIAARLDAAPKQIMEKIPPKLTFRKEVSKGVVVTISTTEPIKI